MRTFHVVAAVFLGALSLVHCSSSIGGDAGDAAPSVDAGSSSDTSAPTPQEAGRDGGAIPQDADGGAAGVGSISLTVDGVTTVLDEVAGVELLANGYSVGAAKVQGATVTGLKIRLLETDATKASIVPTAGVYTCYEGTVDAPFKLASLQYADKGQVWQGGSGTCVTVTSFGAIGQPVTGTFATVLPVVTGGTPAQVRVSGSFNVIRKQ